MAIRFQDRDAIASVLKNELQDTILNIARSHRATIKEKEDRQSREEIAIAQNNADHISKKIGALKLGVSSTQDIDNIRQGINTLRTSYKDNKVLQSSADLLDIELNGFENLYTQRNATISNLDNFLETADIKIKDPYNKTSESNDGIDALIGDIKKSYDNSYTNLTVQDQKFYGEKINDAFGFLSVAKNLANMDVSEEPGLQLNNELTTLGFKDGQLTDTDAFQSNEFQSTLKGAAKAFQEGNYEKANALYIKANELEITEGARARDINAVLNMYYDETGKVRDKWGEETKFFNPVTRLYEKRPMTDVLNTAVSLAKQGQLKEAQKHLNMIPQDIESIKAHNKEITEDMISQIETQFDDDIMGYVNQIDQIQFKGSTITPVIERIGFEKEGKALANAFNLMNQDKFVRIKDKQINEEQVLDLRDTAASAIGILVQGLDKGNLSEKLRTKVKAYENTKPGSKAQTLAANKIAIYLKNNPEEVSMFDFGPVWYIEHRGGYADDLLIREQIQNLFKKYGYINDLHKSILDKENFNPKAGK